MILLSSRKLEEAVSAGKLESWAKAKYLILVAVLGSLQGVIFVIRPYYGTVPSVSTRFASALGAVLTAYVTYWGIKLCFETNKSIDGNAFFERFAVLFVPPMMKLLVIMIPLSIATVYGALALRTETPHVFEFVSIFVALSNPVVTFIFYTMLNNSFRRLTPIIEREKWVRTAL